jgi:cellulose synthase/poly-beta-1,6-N-acetylglucosamine synthase-like glycosyltransferase
MSGQIIFWACAALVAYTYAVYPILIWCLCRLLGSLSVPPSGTDDDLPGVSLLIAAHNEAEVIAERLDNALATDYPRGRFQVVIASDGSSDGTAEIVSSKSTPSVRLLDNKVRRGKAAVLNSAIVELGTDLVVLSDANTEIQPSAVRNLARWFRDPTVGAVCGRLVLVDPASGANADGMYWKYETFLKKCEGRLGALLGSNGAIYAIRRSLYIPIPDNTIVDDFVIPLLVKLRTGARIIYDPESVAVEETPADIGSEFRRRARIGAGGFQAITYLWPLLDPRNGWVAFSFLSHKVLRWICPLLLLGMLICSALLWQKPFYRWCVLAQAAFYGLSLLAMYLPRNSRYLKPLRLTTMFTSMNLALLVGLWRWIRGTQRGTWERTARVIET